jgi:Ubiquitin-binding domain
MCEMLERGEKEEAQAVMEAAGCTCPSGEVWGRRGGIWDEKGERYVVPAWCVGVPKGTVMDGDGNEQEGTDGSGIEEESSDEEETKKKVVEQDKGKGRLVEEEEKVGDLKVRVRMSNTARDFWVRTRPDAKVHTLLKRAREVGEVCQAFLSK